MIDISPRVLDVLHAAIYHLAMAVIFCALLRDV
jgi:hypothetical protein